MGFVAQDVGIDLGTATTIICMKGKGIVLEEPTLAVKPKDDDRRILAIGNDAVTLLGRVTEDVEVVHPIENGIIANFEMAQALIRYMLRNSLGRSYIVKPRIFMGYSCSLSELEQRALKEAAASCGARKVYLTEKAILAALGSGLPIFEAGGCMVVDIGAGTTDVAVISLGSAVAQYSIPVGGIKMDEAISSYIQRNFDLKIGIRTAEQVKLDLGAAMLSSMPRSARVRGREVTTNLHQVREITSDHVYEALKEICTAIRDCIVKVLSHTPPELCADIKHNGIYLTGGASQLYGLNQMLATDLKIPVSLAREPEECTAQGLTYVMEHFDDLQRMGMLESLM